MASSMTPTDICVQMNVVYDALRAATPQELRALHDEAVLRATHGDNVAALFAYQIRETVRRRVNGEWNAERTHEQVATSAVAAIEDGQNEKSEVAKTKAETDSGF